MKQICPSAFLLSFLFLLTGCSSGSESDSTSSGGSSSNGRELTTSCGTPVSGSVENPVNTADGIEAVQVQILEPNLYIVTTLEGDVLAQLHGIQSAKPQRRNAAISRIRRLLNQSIFYFPAGDGCTTTALGGGTAAIGSLVTRGGVSFSEVLLEEGFVEGVQSTGSCAEATTASCYQALFESGATQTAGTISRFLWKPEADRDGRLVVLTNVCNVDIIANGETLSNSGASNGRCTTARSSRSGCAFGTAQVQVIDRTSGLPYAFPDGSTVYTIPNGCDRVEFG
jgi:hypothetical protein